MIHFIHNSALKDSVTLDNGDVYAPTEDDNAPKSLPKVAKDHISKLEKAHKDAADAQKLEAARIEKMIADEAAALTGTTPSPTATPAKAETTG